MGHKNKPNRGSLVKQVQDSLDEKLQIGRKRNRIRLPVFLRTTFTAGKPIIRISSIAAILSNGARKITGARQSSSARRMLPNG